MEKYTLLIKNDIITIQYNEYNEHGWYVEIKDNIITLWEIPFGGGEPYEIRSFDSIIEAINYTITLT